LVSGIRNDVVFEQGWLWVANGFQVNPSDRVARVESLYHAARARTPADRAAFLGAACAEDVELRREVESLLAQPGTGRGLLDTPAPRADGLVSGFGTPNLTGRQFGAYEIRASIGAGGMGEVYRARDTRLGRDVAIKILPTIFSTDPDRRARFEREARVLAALNHPHIGAIYGVEESDGIRALVLELVDGDTLAERIARGPIPIGEALTIARQITDAIDAAHEKGIVHRDLKPANIKITPDGIVKVLDFGLATATTGDGSGPDLTRSPTVTRGGTREGMLLGTAAYMSPEQARGKAIDRRTDVWAFGCVLYEMLTGRVAFAGDTLSDTIAAILAREPDWNRLPADTPVAVELLLRRCLQKNPSDRLRDIADARFRLEESPREGVAVVTRAPRFSHRERLAWLGALAIATIVALVTWTTRHAFEDHLEISTPPTWQPTSFAISPDGRKLAFVASFEGKSLLWLRRLDNPRAEVLPGTENARYPFWKPDGREIGFTVGSDLKRIDLESREVQTVARYVSQFGGVWLEDDTILVTPDASSTLVRVTVSGGQVTPVTKKGPGSFGHRFPRLLPDGRHFLYFAGDDDPGIHVGAFGEEGRKILDATAAVYAPSGHLLFVSEGSLYSQPFDARRLEPKGSRTLIVPSVMPGTTGGSAALSVAAGSIFYRTGDTGSLRYLKWVDRNGKELATLPEFNQMGGMGVSLSDDGAFVAWTQGSEDLWLFEVARGIPTPFTFEPGIDLRPVWEPNGQRVVYSSYRDNNFDLWVKSTTGSGGAERLLPLPGGQYADDWSPDGRFILYTTGSGAGKTPLSGAQALTEIWAVPLDGARTPFQVVRTTGAAASGQFSPDGKWVAFHSNESNRFEISIQPFRGGNKIRLSTGGGMQPRWSYDGKEVFYIGPDNQLMAVSVDLKSPNAPKPGVPQGLFTANWSMDPHNPYVRNFSVSRDGRFLVDVLRATVSPIHVIQNWKPKD
jgi:serine/threonine protein kinase/Tol biopolymer transport system component